MAKTTVERCLTLNINELIRDSKGNSALRPGFIGSIDWSSGSKVSASTTMVDGLMVLRLDFVKNDESVSQDIVIEYSDMPKGGIRPWFRCPVAKNDVPCCRRVGRLYLPAWGRLFACRHCYELAYASQQRWTNPKTKALFRSLELSARLEMMGTRKMTSGHREYYLKACDELAENMRKAGILPNDYELPE